MTAKARHRLLEEITRFYLESSDFNGIPVLSVLTGRMRLGWNALVDDLRQLIADEKVCVIYSTTDVNPHVMRTGYESPEEQIAKLETIDRHACAYPLSRHLEQVVDKSEYAGRPYELAMALGDAQLSHRAFDLSILEFYRNDPRYKYRNDDIRGSIYLSDEEHASGDMAASDMVFLQSFGFCHDEDLNRAVAVFLRYLYDLTPEHQQIWKAKELEGDYTLHPDYFRNTIRGVWGEGVSVFDAFIGELQVINEIARAVGRPPLFTKDFSEDRKPTNFTFLVRPTLKELNDFMLLLDKMISDNINRDFFQGEVPYEFEETLGDGRIVVRHKGTLTILDEWIHSRFRPQDWEPIDEMLRVFRQIRRKRQRPAHAIDENVFHQGYFREQRELITQAYEGVRTLRLLLANFPKADDVEVPSFLKEGTIWTC